MHGRILRILALCDHGAIPCSAAVPLDFATDRRGWGGTFLDVRAPRPAPAGIYDPVDYTAGQALGIIVRTLRGFGILYDSVRRRGGECVAVMRPPVLRGAVAVQTLQFVWDGTTVTDVR